MKTIYEKNHDFISWRAEPSEVIRYIQIVYVVLTLLISFFVIPHFNNGRDIFLFSDWRLFADPPQAFIYDITWDEGHSFLFRDHRKRAGAVGIKIYSLFRLTQNENIQRIKVDHLKMLRKMGSCEKLWLVKLRGPLYKHILFNENLERIRGVRICED